MIFNSIPFIIFAIIFFAFWGSANKNNTSRWTFLTGMSFVFYGWWDWRFLFLIIFSGLVDYFAGLFLIKKPKNRRLFLGLSLLGNLGSLFIFKYSLFFANTMDFLFAKLGVGMRLSDNIPEFALILPVGISFYTFQSLSYTIDIYRGRLKPTKNILHFFAYLSMFPQLVAGPVVRAKDLLGQLATQRIASPLQKWHGIKLIAFGLFQKTVLADNLGVMVNKAHHLGNTDSGTLFWWLATLCFTLQIYCDFSGYSLIARGLAKYMGYHFKMNFNHPYLATSFQNFWRRWHISLSTWFRDYVYIPLGGNKKGFLMGILFMILTMLISGLWHGAGITFLIWGLAHGVLLAVERIGGKVIKLPKLISFILVLVLVNFTWVFFRASDYETSKEIISNMVVFETSTDFQIKYIDPIFYLGLAAFIEFIYWIYNSSLSLKSFYRKSNLDVVFVSLAIVACLFLRGPSGEFIYFQF